MDTKTQSGFTLIELLTAIAVVCIIAAILFPVFAQAREQARKTACLSNLKQIGMADLQYDQDYDETLWSTPEPGGIVYVGFCDFPQCAGTTMWTDLMMPYIKNSGIFSCPSYSGPLVVTPDFYNFPGNVPAAAPSGWAAPGVYRVTYGFAGNNFDLNNNIIGTGPHADGEHPVYKLSDLAAPAEVAMEADANYSWNLPTCQVDPEKPGRIGSLYFAEGDQVNYFYGTQIHFNGMDFVYADGHAKWCKASTTASPNNHPWAIGYYPNARVNGQDCTNYDE